MATVRDKNLKKRVKLPQVPTVPSDEMMPSPNMTQKKTINSLPNEMLRYVFVKLEIDKLIGIRRVCTRWQEMAEDICREKRSIMIESKDKNIPDPDLSSCFKGLVDFSKNWIILKVKPTKYKRNVIALSSDLCIVLEKLFPQVENLVLNVSLQRNKDTADNLFTLLDNWSSTLVTLGLSLSNTPMLNCINKSRCVELFDHINNLANLKHFVFGEPLKSTYKLDFLTRLVHCTFSADWIMDQQIVAIPFLGKNCTSLRLLQFIRLKQITQFLKLNAPFVKGLTHLGVTAFEGDVLSFICTNFCSLQRLDIEFLYKNFNADTITDLARLCKLTHLSIQSFGFDLPVLAQSNLSTVSSVNILAITNFSFLNDGKPFDGDQFCRILSFVFPNLHQLTIKHRTKQVRTAIVHHLDHFINLRKHVITSK